MTPNPPLTLPVHSKSKPSNSKSAVNQNEQNISMLPLLNISPKGTNNLSRHPKNMWKKKIAHWSHIIKNEPTSTTHNGNRFHMLITVVMFG